MGKQAIIMKKKRELFVLLTLVALLLTGCLGTDTTYQQKDLGDGKTLELNTQVPLAGKLYFTLNHDLYVLDASGPKQLTKGMEVVDPAISPDGKTLAFIIRYKNYSDLAIMPATGGKPKVLLTGKGEYIPNPNYPAPKSTHVWYAQPAWRDNTHLLFLSDLRKLQINPGQDAFMLDLMAFSIDINDSRLSQINAQTVDDYPDVVQHVTYSIAGDGGHRDLSVRPGHPGQIVFTSYKYDASRTHQVVQLFLQDADAIAHAPQGTYQPGIEEIQKDPAVALTPDQADLFNMQASFSPDGNTFVYIRKPNPTSNMELYTMPVAEDVTATPNDKATEQKALQPYSQSTMLLQSQYISQPIWSPDGKYIAYIGYENNIFNLYVLEVVKEGKTYKKNGDPIQVIKTDGQKVQLNADSRLIWTK